MQQLRHEASHEADPQAALAEIESEAAEYRAIAERRVRLGLLLSEIGAANGVEVSQREMNQLIGQAASQYQGKDRERFIQYVQQEPMAAAQLRAPLYEDKVVDFLFSKAEITDRAATRAELEADLEAEEGHVMARAAARRPEAKEESKKAAAKADSQAGKARQRRGRGEGRRKPKPAKPLKGISRRPRSRKKAAEMSVRGLRAGAVSRRSPATPAFERGLKADLRPQPPRSLMPSRNALMIRGPPPTSRSRKSAPGRRRVRKPTCQHRKPSRRQGSRRRAKAKKATAKKRLLSNSPLQIRRRGAGIICHFPRKSFTATWLIDSRVPVFAGMTTRTRGDHKVFQWPRSGNRQQSAAVLLPCYNEEAAIGCDRRGLPRALPSATIYVYDNNSRDRTREVRRGGRGRRTESQQGKGRVVPHVRRHRCRRLLMADGDLTYDPDAAPEMARMLLDDQLDMVVGTRQHEARGLQGRPCVRNKLFTRLLAGLFGTASLISSPATASSRAGS